MELVKIDFALIKNMVVKSEGQKVYAYENGKRTDLVKGYRYRFIVMDDKNPLNLKDYSVRFDGNDPEFEIGQKVQIDYDSSESKIYATTKKDSTFANINISLVAESFKVVA